MLSGGPTIYLLGSAIYKKVVYGAVPMSQIIGVIVLAALVPVALVTDLLTIGWLTTAVMLAVSVWHSKILRRRGAASRSA